MRREAKEEVRLGDLPDAPAAPREEAARRSGRGTALGTAVGFACGAVFWHALGVAGLSIRAPANPTGESAYALADAGATSSIETGSLPTIYRVDPAVCTSLALDRQSNRTVVRPCPAEGLALRLDHGDDRGDLAALADHEAR